MIDSLIEAAFERREHTLVFVDDAKTFGTFVETGVLSTELATEAPKDTPVVVALETEATDFLAAEGSQPLETFLRHAYLTAPEPGWLVLADPRPLYDLLREAVPTVQDHVPPITQDRLLKRYRTRPWGYYRAPSALTEGALSAVKRGTAFCGMFSVCPRDGEPLCYSTYAWIEQSTCLLMATYDGYISLEFFPFRVVASPAGRATGRRRRR